MGDKVCATCHQKIAETYHRHPMGRSAEWTISAPQIERYDTSAHNPFAALGRFEFRVERRTHQVLHHVITKDKNGEKQSECAVEATMTIGSGTQGRSYLTVQGGIFWQSPISWFAERGRWDISPGFNDGSKFQRPVIEACLFCHVNHVEAVPHTINRYRELPVTAQLSIGCERCHGPGEQHVAERSTGAAIDEIDTSIVNPKHLEPELRDSVCQQCHLQGQDRIARRGRELSEYRPGLPLEVFVSVYSLHPSVSGGIRSVGQVEQLAHSKCAIASGGKLGCTSCHDPHSVPDASAKAAFYRSRCVACHEEPNCNPAPPGRLAKADNCVSCHMPRLSSTNVAHVAVTDHRIPRLQHSSADLPAQTAKDESPVIPLFNGRFVTDPTERERDLGVFLSKMAENAPRSAADLRRSAATAAESKLRLSLLKWPEDIVAREALARTLYSRGESREALHQIKKALDVQAYRESALISARDFAASLEEFPFALECASKAIELDPFSVNHRLMRARILVAQQRWSEAAADCRAIIDKISTPADAHVLLAVCLFQQGDGDAARQELDRSLRLARDPDLERQYLDFYQRMTRRRRQATWSHAKSGRSD
jgi:predicted CXXCH cytochrome family protein